MDVVLAPDIYVNASIALGSPPERAVRRAFGGPAKPKTSNWVMERVESMLHALPEFKDDAVARQMTTIRGLVDVVEIGLDREVDEIRQRVGQLLGQIGTALCRRGFRCHVQVLSKRDRSQRHRGGKPAQ